MTTQIGYQKQYDGRVVPVYRLKSSDPWVPTIQHSIQAKPDIQGGTEGFSKWQALLASGAKVIGGEV